MIAPFISNHTTQRLAVKLKSKAEGYIRQGHPWVFESSITKINKEGVSGDLAIIFDNRDNKYLGLGLYDIHSPIRIKMIAHGEKAILNQDWFDNKISYAYGLRLSLLENDVTAYRLVFGENDGLPGLIIDVYAKTVVVKLYSAIWIPYLHFILESVIGITQCDSIVLRLSRLLQSDKLDTHGLVEGQILYGELDNPEIEFIEYGVKFIANVIKGHKTGYFLDHRHNRRKVGLMSNKKSVLDVFSYAGGFSTHAIMGGASRVLSIDISKYALEMAKRNVSLNVAKANHETMTVDAFVGMQSLIDDNITFDIVVVDPPSFAKQAADIDKAKNSYFRLAKLAIQLVASQGMCVMASCSSRITPDDFFKVTEDGFDQSDKSYRLIEKTFHDSDHPVTFPEGSYLKCGYYKIS
ncbi:MAG: class I SAM-dependent rRNA methyltransferase [Saprospiraceae bacterium]